jgi:hypothetical protein
MIIGIRTKSRIVSATASLMWVTGLVLAIILTVNIVGNFSEKSNVKQEIVLPQPKEVLTIDVNDNLPGIRNAVTVDEENSESDVNDHRRFIFNNCFFVNHDDKLVAYGFPKLKILPSKTDQYKLTVAKFSRGTTMMAARERAEAIQSEVLAPDSTLMISNYFLLPPHEKWRNQSVKLYLEVPEGKSILMTKNLENLIYDRDNIDGSWNLDMIGKKMTMHDGRLVENYGLTKNDTIRVKNKIVKK